MSPGAVALRLTPGTPNRELVLAPASAADTPNRRVVAWDASLVRYGAQQLNDRYRARFGEPMSSDAWLGWFAVKLLWESAARARDATPDALRRYVTDSTRRFDGHKGVGLFFGADGRRPPLTRARGVATNRVVATYRVGRRPWGIALVG